jgi:hypothetical protein
MRAKVVMAIALVAMDVSHGFLFYKQKHEVLGRFSITWGATMMEEKTSP